VCFRDKDTLKKKKLEKILEMLEKFSQHIWKKSDIYVTNSSSEDNSLVIAYCTLQNLNARLESLNLDNIRYYRNFKVKTLDMD
jgi:hypothetical protein